MSDDLEKATDKLVSAIAEPVIAAGKEAIDQATAHWKQRAEAAEAKLATLEKASQIVSEKCEFAEAEVARLREALVKYGNHKETCAAQTYLTGTEGGGHCTCGLRQVLTQEKNRS